MLAAAYFVLLLSILSIFLPCSLTKSTGATDDYYPSFGDYVSFTQEVVSSMNEQDVLTNKVFFNYKDKLAVYEYYDGDVMSSTEIHDFNEGVNYVQSLADYEIRSLTSKDDAVKNNDWSLSMFTANQLMHWDNSFIKNGTGKVRNQVCDIYTTDEWHVNSTEVMHAEYYFLQSALLKKKTVLLRIKQNISPESNRKHFLHGFSNELPDYSHFNYGDYLGKGTNLKVSIQFPNSDYDLNKAFVQAIRTKLSSVMDIEPWRVQDIMLRDTYQMTTYVDVTILERPEPIHRYTKTSIKVPYSKKEPYISLPSAESCADACEKSSKVACLSFYYCEIPYSRCLLRESRIAKNVETAEKPCYLYIRTVNRGTKKYTTLAEAYIRLRSAVESGQLSLPFHVTEDYGGKAISIEVIFGNMKRAIEPKLPSIPERYSVKYQHHDYTRSVIYDGWIYYDKRLQIIKMDSGQFKNASNAVNARSTIRDFSTGMQYNIDTSSGSCAVTQMDGSLPGSFKYDNSIQITKGEKLLWREEKPGYLWIGKETFNGHLCDTFEYDSKGWIYRVYSTSVDVNSNNMTTVVPIGFEILDVKRNQLTSTSYSDFDYLSQLSDIDLSYCFKAQDKIIFVLGFKLPKDYKSGMESVIENKVYSYLRNQLSLVPMRLSNGHVGVIGAELLYTATLLPSTPTMSRFKVIKKNMADASSDRVTVTAASTVDICAEKCLYKKYCRAFDYGDKKKCRLVIYTSKAKPSDSYDHYYKIMDNDVVEFPSNIMYQTLVNRVYNGDIKIPIEADNSNDPLVAESVNTQGGDRNRENIKLFIKSGPGSVTALLRLSGLAIDECASACVDNLNFTCSAFSYDTLELVCSLSATRSTASSTSFSVVYYRNYTDDYDMLDGVQVSWSSGQSVKNLDVNQCAKLCTTKADDCLSFIHCRDSSKCTISDSRYPDGAKTYDKSSLNCVAFSKNLLNDFYEFPGRVIPSPHLLRVGGISPRDCAKRCVDMLGASCYDFHYCPTVAECRLSHQTARFRRDTQTTFCYKYARKSINVTTAATTTVVEQTKHYTSGEMAALAIGMLVLGVLLVVGVVCFINRNRRHHDGSFSMTSPLIRPSNSVNND